MERSPITDKASPPPRFLVRQGSKGWMVYDRQRRAGNGWDQSGGQS
jgi:hypothetical protein